jgi:endonuclease/exonuclease/phosphatase family metal-dependent hydrolase
VALVGASVAASLAAACGPPSLAECIDRVDPELRELGFVPEAPVDLSLEVDANVRIMTMNVGNGEDEGPYALRLLHQPYEDWLAARIQGLRPDVIALQEVLPRHTCIDDGEAWEADERYTCFEADQREDQVRRLVGPDYSIVCDDVRSVDCLAVHVDFGTIEGLAAGGYDPEWSGTLALPDGFRRCDYVEHECFEKLAVCDRESSVTMARIQTVAGPVIHTVHMHPSAFGQACRENQLAAGLRLSSEAKASDPDIALMVLGDWNFDPDRLGRPVEELLYYSHVGPGQLMREHDERDDVCARPVTGPLDLASLDRVVTDFARGFCEVQHDDHVPIGASEPRGRFDDDFDEWDVFAEGEEDEHRMDHATVICDLYWPDLG